MDDTKVRLFGFSLSPATLIQIITIAIGIVGAYYTMRLQLEYVEDSLKTFLSNEHTRLVSRVDAIDLRLDDGRERLKVVEERQGDMRERISRLEQRVFDGAASRDQSDERWHAGGRALSQEQVNKEKGQ